MSFNQVITRAVILCRNRAPAFTEA